MILFESKRIQVMVEYGKIVTIDGQIRVERNDTAENREDAIAEAEALASD